ncbi:amidase [Limobrevibacterium gyesilva]|uniref:Amidase n=1 Tax=Limobrevibacterium gyesilva TaxID=2991712 RepID=A0AA41YUI2_9PROT|nr:amidase [Limobrevibacterium gyesilva]MCW3476828.1 amidase [Limobrevibacterium gyesilva]
MQPPSDPLGEDRVGAFVPGPRATMAATGTGPLDGLTLAVKDLFDVAGALTTFGNPDWARTHPPAPATAPVVAALLEAGARLVGKTKTVELAYGLTGENIWHGTPLNPRAPDRFPGGSSCGSAAAVAAGLVDLALGSDTGGSVRIPASYCGLFGIRPSHGAISLAGACPLAPSLDTPGWFTRSAALLATVGEVVLPPATGGVGGPLLRVGEAWVNAAPAVAAALTPALERLQGEFGPALQVQLAPEGIPTLHAHFRAVQAQEAWAALGGWIAATGPRFGPGVAERFAAARDIAPQTAAAGRAFRRTLQARIGPLLAGGAMLVYPTSPCPAPRRDAQAGEQEAVRQATLSVTAIAGLCGLPEVTLPVASVDGAPVGLSLVAGPGRDRALLAVARHVAGLLGLD